MRKEWNTDEVNFLQDNIGLYKITTIAKKMGRSYESIVMKINRLGLSNTRMQTGRITLGELSRHLKEDRNTTKCWVENHGLPCIKKVTRSSKRFYLINPSDFWKWAEANKEKVKFSNIEPYTILPEPDWVEQERQKDKHIRKKRTYRHWTTDEDQRLVDLRNKGLTYKEIGQEMNRSVFSLEHRYKRITEK